MTDMLQRLDKVIASQTSYSRKDVHKLLSKNQVLVNGSVVRNKDYKIAVTDQVTVCGDNLQLEPFVYIMLNKPQNVVCATKDERLKTVLDLIPVQLKRDGLFPAGRLDKDTTGFVLLTNDGAFAHRILAPNKHVPKLYDVWLDKPVPKEVAMQFAQGVVLQPVKNEASQIGAHARCREIQCLPAKLEFVDSTDQNHVQVTIKQGVYHQIKRMFAQFDLTVVKLHRLAIGGLRLDETLKPGNCRKIETLELAKIEGS